MRLLHEVQSDEVLVCAGEYRYNTAGKPNGQIEHWQNSRLPSGKEITRVELTGEVDGQPMPEGLDFPSVEDGVEGMAFIAATVQSAKGGAVWTKMQAA